MPTALPLISVIIPCYNYAAYIRDAIESIQAQTYTNWEMLIIDDGSKDNTAAIAQDYARQDARIHYHYQANRGLSAARNTGLGLAQGEYVQLLDADDYLAPRKLELHAQVLHEQPDVALAFGDTYNFQHSEVVAERKIVPLHLQMGPLTGQGQALALHMAYDNMFLPGNPVFRRVLADQIGKFNEQLFSLEDWHFWYRGVLRGAKYVYDNRPGTEFYARTHGNNMSGNRHKMWKYKIKAREALIEQLRSQLATPAPADLAWKPILTKHLVLLYEEQARFNLLYGSVGQGVVNTVRYFFTGEKPVRIWYDSAYWFKERLLGRNKIVA
jgi:glycosyltransferase involved in cell wall biosynthesis